MAPKPLLERAVNGKTSRYEPEGQVQLLAPSPPSHGSGPSILRESGSALRAGEEKAPREPRGARGSGCGARGEPWPAGSPGRGCPAPRLHNGPAGLGKVFPPRRVQR